MKSAITMFFAIFILFTGCNRNAQNIAIDYSDLKKHSGLKYYELQPKNQFISIENIPIGKKVYIAKTNSSEHIIAREESQPLISADGLTLNTKKNAVGLMEKDIRPTADFEPPRIYTKYEKLISVDLAKESEIKKSSDIAEKDFNLGDEKDIYIDINSLMNIHEKSTAKLTAKGKYCYVWVIESYKNEKLLATSQKLSQAFDSMYPIIQGIFGKESDAMYCNYNGNFFETKPIECLSETGNKVNIVIYDIGRKNNGVVGYFHSKDYFPSGKNYENNVLNFSNEGKYIYLDSQWAEADEKICISTLAHEFQHMINYNQKTIKNGEIPTNTFNEMMSLVCEEIISEPSENDNLSSRLALFNSGYADCGIEYRINSHYYAMLSYAVNYAFGSWLLNNLGGTSLIKKIATNSYSNIQAITKASGKNIRELLKCFSLDCLNQSSANFNLWHLHKTNYDIEGYKYDGPALFPYNAKHEIRPYGILFIKAGDVESDCIRLFFGKKNKKEESLYIVIE